MSSIVERLRAKRAAKKAEAGDTPAEEPKVEETETKETETKETPKAEETAEETVAEETTEPVVMDGGDEGVSLSTLEKMKEDTEADMKEAAEASDFAKAAELKAKVTEIEEEIEAVKLAIKQAEEEAKAEAEASTTDEFPDRCPELNKAGERCVKDKDHDAKHWYKGEYKGAKASSKPEETEPSESPASSKPVSHEVNGKLTVRRTFTKSGEIMDETNSEEMIEVQPFATEPAKVSCAFGTTINMGDYESCKVDCHITVPCYLEEVHEAFQFARGFVADKIAKEAADIREIRDK